LLAGFRSPAAASKTPAPPFPGTTPNPDSSGREARPSGGGEISCGCKQKHRAASAPDSGGARWNFQPGSCDFGTALFNLDGGAQVVET